MKLPIYLDYAATTPVDPRVAEQMCRYLTRDGVFGNPSSHGHTFGRAAAQAVEAARAQVAALVNADPDEIIWTSGATESNNWVFATTEHLFPRGSPEAVRIACVRLLRAELRPTSLPADDAGDA